MMKGLNAYLRRTLSFALAVCMVSSLITPAAAEGASVCMHGKSQETVNATCIQDGYTRTYCPYCYETFSIVPTGETAPGHDWGEPSSVAATCTTPGQIVRVCARCGEKASVEDASAPALGHTMGDWVVTTKATCSATGVKTRTCGICGESETEEIPLDKAHGHSWKTTVYEQSTCVTHGKNRTVCNICGRENFSDRPLNANAHSFPETYTTVTPATCTTAGLESRTCTNTNGDTVCTETQTREIPPLGHNWSELMRPADLVVTCTSPYNLARICMNDCGEIKYEEQPAPGHNWGGWVESIPATCSTNGLQTHVCQNCGESETGSIPALGHAYGEWQTGATCTEGGMSWRECTRSGCNAQELSMSGALGHDWGEYTVTLAPTCIAEGTKVRICIRCSDTDSAVIPVDTKSGHSWVTSVIPADCEHTGMTYYSCELCEEEKSELIPALGHSWGAYTTTLAPTCIAEGTKVRTCSACPATDSAVIPVDTENGHNYVINANESAPATCESGGYNTKECTICGDIIREYTAVSGTHKWDNGTVIAAATCAAPGVKKYTCTVCGAAKTEEIAKLTTHSGSKVNGGLCAVTYCSVCNQKIGNGIHQLVADGGTVISSVGDYDNYEVVISCRVSGCNWKDTTIYTSDSRSHSISQTSGSNEYTLTYKLGSVTRSKDPKTAATGAAQSPSAITHTNPVTTKAATCTEDGVITYTCSNPGACKNTANHTVTIPAIGHSYGVTSRVEPDCTAEGSITYTCKVCGDVKTEAIPAVPHQPVDTGTFENVVDAKCEIDGSRDRIFVCAKCGGRAGTETEAIPALVHIEGAAVKENEVPVKCEEDGSYDSVVYCTLCQKELSRNKVVEAATGHTPRTGIQENFENATCLEIGGYDTVSYCEHCNKELERVHNTIPALGHAASELRNTRAATEDAEGYTGDVVCPRCNEILTAGTVIPRLSTGENVEIEPEIILEVLNEEIKLDASAVEDLTVLAKENGNNALELLTTVNGTLNALEVELSTGRITPEEYRRCVEVANVAVSVALTVGAKAGSAAEEAAKQAENLPEDAGLDMGAIVGDFYQRQFDAILGKGEPSVKSLSAFDGDMSGIKLIFVADTNLTANGIDLSVDPEVYRSALVFIDDSVDKMSEAAATLRSCSGEAMVASVKQYIEKVAVSVFRDFDKEAADEEFLQNAYDAILLNMQQQVSLSLTEAYEEASKSGKFTGTAKTELDKRYEEQMAAVADVETFEIMVLEVMRQKYVSVLNTQLEAGTITRESYDAAWANAVDVETFEPIYWAIFRAWALNEESEYPMTLQELTDATIADTTYATTHIELRDSLSGQEIAFLTAAVVLSLLLGAAYIVSNSMNKRKVVA